jgi:hypothetical protein
MCFSILPLPFVSVTILQFHLPTFMLLSLLVKLPPVTGTVYPLQCSFDWSIILKLCVYSNKNSFSECFNEHTLEGSLVILEPAIVEFTITVNKATLTFANIGSYNPLAIVNISIWKLDWLSFFALLVQAVETCSVDITEVKRAELV